MAGKYQNKDDELFKINGDWQIQSKNLKLKFSLLTDADVRFEPGKEDELLKRLEYRLSKKREDVIRLIIRNNSETA